MNDKKWITDLLPDLTGKVILVTGANSGIGFEASKEFARKGAKIILASRNISKAKTALQQINEITCNNEIEIMQLDLASKKSIHDFAKEFKAKHSRLDVLLNNAGIMMVPYGLTEDGFERQMGTNHLGHFLLTGLLIDLIKNTPKSRVVNVSSGAHHMGKINFKNLQFNNGRGYTPMKSYSQSKLANLLFTYELQNRFDKEGIDAIAVAAHPGGANTNLGQHLNESLMGKIMKPVMSRMMQSASMGALPSIRAAADKNVDGKDYYGPGGFMQNTGYPVKVKSSKASHNKYDQQKLWEKSEMLTGIKYL